MVLDIIRNSRIFLKKRSTVSFRTDYSNIKQKGKHGNAYINIYILFFTHRPI